MKIRLTARSTTRQNTKILSTDMEIVSCKRATLITNIKVIESRYTALFAVSGPIKKLFSIDYVNYVNIYLFSIFFSIDFARWISVGLPDIAHIVIH